MDFKSLISRKLSGEMSPEEERIFQEILLKEPEKQALLEEYRKIWDSVGSVGEATSYDLDAEWNLVQTKLPGFENGQQVHPLLRAVRCYITATELQLCLFLVLFLPSHGSM